MDAHAVLTLLGHGESLEPAIRSEMEAAFRADFGDVRVHRDGIAERIGEQIGAEAFAIGRHIAFRRGRFQPNSSAGEQLLRHEVSHTVEAAGRDDCIRCWNSSRVNPGTKDYTLRGVRRQVLVVSDIPGTTHEALVRQAIARVTDFGGRARQVLDFWVAESDRWKDRFPELVAQGFTDLGTILSEERNPDQLLHAYGGCEVGRLGMSDDTVTASLTGRGLIGRLLTEAIRNYQSGSAATDEGSKQRTTDHALRLLGISLHAIQDFFSHKVRILDEHNVDLRPILAREGNRHNPHIGEDDPSIDHRRRWDHALSRSCDQIYNFRQGLNFNARQLLRSPSAR
jgi:hypothetical protein